MSSPITEMFALAWSTSSERNAKLIATAPIAMMTMIRIA
jgi:hypothetical protein